MIIPKTYTQFGRTVNVSLQPPCDFQDYNGICAPDKSIIKLVSGFERTHTEHTFLHEALHMQMSLMQRHDLYTDENFINVLSGLMHQMLHTGKGSL